MVSIHFFCISNFLTIKGEVVEGEGGEKEEQGEEEEEKISQIQIELSRSLELNMESVNCFINVKSNSCVKDDAIETAPPLSSSCFFKHPSPTIVFDDFRASTVVDRFILESIIELLVLVPHIDVGLLDCDNQESIRRPALLMLLPATVVTIILSFNDASILFNEVDESIFFNNL